MAEVLTSQNFKEKVVEAEGKILVDFFATWCGPCKMFSPVIDEIAEQVDNKVYKVDIDQSPDVAAKYGVHAVPTLVVFENGEEVNSAIGVQPKQAVLELLK